MSAEFVVFWIMAPVSLGAAIAMVLMRSAVHSALMLVLNFFTIAVLYALLEAQFLAVAQIIVYAGAVMVLFLFVLMLLGIQRNEPASQRLRAQKPAAVLLGVVLFAFLAVSVAGPFLSAEDACPADAGQAAVAAEEGTCQGLAEANVEGNVRGVGLLLFTDYVWPFEVTSALLVVAAMGAMVLGRRREDPADLVDRLPVEDDDGDDLLDDSDDDDVAGRPGGEERA